LKNFVVVLGTGVDNRYRIDNFSKGNATPIISYGHIASIYGDVDFLTMAHNEFINGIVYNFFEENVNTIVGVITIAQATNVHACAQTNVFE
jgi:hypothetical protein